MKLVFVSPGTGKPLNDRGTSLSTDDDSEVFEIRKGVIRFVDDSNYADAFGLQWNRYAKTQLDSYTQTDITERRLMTALGQPLENLRGKTVLEAGCGAGRFTEVLLKYGATVFTFDLSNAIEANVANNSEKGDVTFFQADIENIPLHKQAFDFVICLGVVQHTPSTERTIASLYQHVKPSGLLVFDHYKRSLGQYTSLYLVYWFIIRRLTVTQQLWVTESLTKLFFPIHWFFRDSKFVQMCLRRISPINFYYGNYPLRTKELHFEWSQLDTHDRNTDHYKRNLSKEQLERILRSLKINDYDLELGGTGYLCRIKNQSLPS